MTPQISDIAITAPRLMGRDSTPSPPRRRSDRSGRRIGAARAFGPLSYRWLANGSWPVGQLVTPVPTRPWVTRRDSRWQCPKRTGRALSVDSELPDHRCRRDAAL
jgi:hypothetical protein